MMRAVFSLQSGPPGSLVIRKVPVPQPAPTQVRIAVRAASVSFLDSLIISDRYQYKPVRPFSPGSEVAGVVDAVGENVNGIETGLRVAAVLGYGGFAEFVLADREKIVSLPRDMTFSEAAGYLGSYGTSYHALHDRAALRRGENLLVLGAAGGVGLAAVQIGCVSGAKVIAAASSREKLEFAKKSGAQHTINYTDGRFREELTKLTNGKGVDIVFDPVGNHLTEKAFRSLAPNGRHLVVGFAAGEIPKISTNLALLKESSLVGVLWGAFCRREPEACRANFEKLNALYEAGRIHPVVSKIFRLEDAAVAIAHVMSGSSLGKTVIAPNQLGGMHL